MKPAPSWRFEEAARQRGFTAIGGVDEAGRGPIAGPVVAACVILPFGAELPSVRDSKQLSPSQREAAALSIRACAEAVGIAAVSVERIDQMNILRAAQEAMREAARQCCPRLEFALVDGLPVPAFPVPHQALLKGDALSVSVASASILAKVRRDEMMRELDGIYPGYGFGDHKGYPTPAHLDQLAALGPCPAHRRSFAPVREVAHRNAPQLDLDESEVRDAGAEGELVARGYLEGLGLRILDARYRCREGELDLVGLDGSEVVFVEVKTKTRGVKVGGCESVHARKRQRLAAAAEAYLQEHNLLDSQCRFDVVEVILGTAQTPSVRYVRGAFLAGE